MRARLLRLVALVAPLLALASPARAVESCHRTGDDPRWAQPDWDDRDWARGNYITVHGGIQWVRVRFQLRETRLDLLPDAPKRVPSGLRFGGAIDGIFAAAPYSYEFYWDGRLIGRSGVVGASREEEQVGPLDNVFTIPPELRGPGEHVAALRISIFHYNFPAAEIPVGFLPCNVAGHYREEAQHPVIPLIGVGAALVIGLLSLLLYLIADRWRPLLLCSAACFALGLFYLLVAWRWIHPDPYDWLYYRLLINACVMTVVSWLFPWMLIEQFNVPKRGWWLGVLFALLVGAWFTSMFYEIKALWMCRAMLAVSAGITGWAAWRRRPGARFVLVGVLLGLLLVQADRRDFLDPSFFLSFGVLVLLVFANLGLQLRADRRQAQQARFAAARLETELLKKNIQPHFLMNTLTTITEVIEQDPKAAVELIDALAGEFRILARVSGEKLIPLGEELELCRAHLHIMGLRRGITCTFEVRDVDEASPVPPALFHTLVEGGLSHQQPRAGRLKFVLAAAYRPGLARYVLTVHGDNPPMTGAPRDGTGLRYVKARLEESFAGRWTLQAGPVEEGWQTTIEIQHPPGESGSA